MNVYVITPVGSDSAFVAKRSILQSIQSELGVFFHLPLERKDYEHATSAQVLNDLQQADLVIADLSFARPSCYFEVGLAQGLGKSVSLLATAGTEIHQVFGRKDVAYYNGLAEYEAVLRNILRASR